MLCISLPRKVTHLRHCLFLAVLRYPRQKVPLFFGRASAISSQLFLRLIRIQLTEIQPFLLRAIFSSTLTDVNFSDAEIQSTQTLIKNSSKISRAMELSEVSYNRQDKIPRALLVEVSGAHLAFFSDSSRAS